MADDGLLFKEFSDEYYPSADDLVRYLQAYATSTHAPIRFDSRVTKVERWGTHSHGFKLTTNTNVQYTCNKLFWATGIPKPVAPSKGTATSYFVCDLAVSNCHA